jgi:hypothetical protein
MTATRSSGRADPGLRRLSSRGAPWLLPTGLCGVPRRTDNAPKNMRSQHAAPHNSSLRIIDFGLNRFAVVTRGNLR